MEQLLKRPSAACIWSKRQEPRTGCGLGPPPSLDSKSAAKREVSDLYACPTPNCTFRVALEVC